GRTVVASTAERQLNRLRAVVASRSRRQRNLLRAVVTSTEQQQTDLLSAALPSADRSLTGPPGNPPTIRTQPAGPLVPSPPDRSRATTRTSSARPARGPVFVSTAALPSRPTWLGRLIASIVCLAVLLGPVSPARTAEGA